MSKQGKGVKHYPTSEDGAICGARVHYPLYCVRFDSDKAAHQATCHACRAALSLGKLLASGAVSA